MDLIEELAVRLANIELGSQCADLTEEDQYVWYHFCLEPCCRIRLRSRAAELLALVRESDQEKVVS